MAMLLHLFIISVKLMIDACRILISGYQNRLSFALADILLAHHFGLSDFLLPILDEIL